MMNRTDELRQYDVHYTLLVDIDNNPAGPRARRVVAYNPEYAKHVICAILSVMPDSGSINFRKVVECA